MSHGPGLFNVYFVGVGDTSLNYTQNSPLYLVTFFSRTEADNWWRSIQLSSHNSSTSIRRFTPQFIMAPLPNIQDGWECIIQTLKDNFNPRKTISVVSDSRTDHLNGRGYRIRSATKPHRYWSLRNDGRLCFVDPKQNGNMTIYEYPTRFTIRRSNKLSYELDSVREDEDILIGEDDVEISVTPRWIGETPLKVYMIPLNIETVEEAFRVITTIQPNEPDFDMTIHRYIFKFSWFENGFFMQNTSQCLWDVYLAPGKGERWELVE